MLQHVRIKLKHGDMRGNVFTTYCILVILNEPKAIPSVASIWKEKDIV